MRFEGYSFGSIQIDGRSFDHDVVIEHGEIRKRKKAASKAFRETYGHTPLSVAEDIPWGCRRLVIGTGAAGAPPVMDKVEEEARRRNVPARCSSRIGEVEDAFEIAHRVVEEVRKAVGEGPP